MSLTDSPVWVIYSKWAIYADWFAAFGTWAGVIVTALTLLFLWKQINILAKQTNLLSTQVHDLRESIHSSTYQNVYELMIEIDRFFIQHKHLKPHFYPGTTAGRNIHVDPDELASAAEMMMDYFDCVFHQRSTMPEDTFYGFSKYMRSVFDYSDALRNLVETGERKNWYPKDFVNHLRGGENEQLEGERDRRNSSRSSA